VRRTLYAVTLQLGRARATLVQLLVAQFLGNPASARLHAKRTARTILEFARDRNGGRFIRTLYDIQEREDSLTSPRPTRVRPPPRPKKVKSTSGKKRKAKDAAGEITTNR
jgi:hypothetical protein